MRPSLASLALLAAALELHAAALVEACKVASTRASAVVHRAVVLAVAKFTLPTFVTSTDLSRGFLMLTRL